MFHISLAEFVTRCITMMTTITEGLVQHVYHPLVFLYNILFNFTDNGGLLNIARWGTYISCSTFSKEALLQIADAFSATSHGDRLGHIQIALIVKDEESLMPPRPVDIPCLPISPNRTNRSQDY